MIELGYLQGHLSADASAGTSDHHKAFLIQLDGLLLEEEARDQVCHRDHDD